MKGRKHATIAFPRTPIVTGFNEAGPVKGRKHVLGAGNGATHVRFNEAGPVKGRKHPLGLLDGLGRPDASMRPAL